VLATLRGLEKLKKKQVHGVNAPSMAYLKEQGHRINPSMIPSLMESFNFIFGLFFLSSYLSISFLICF
jgi:hypothetical protein